MALHGHRWHARDSNRCSRHTGENRRGWVSHPLYVSLNDPVESQQAEQVVCDAFAVVLETELADPEDGDPVALQPGVLAVVTLAVGGEHVVALAVGLGHDPLVGPVEVQFPAAEVDVALGRRDPWVGRQPCGELTLEAGLVGGGRAVGGQRRAQVADPGEPT